MAKIIDVTLVCDICHDLDENQRVPVAESISPSFDGKVYELDLCSEHLETFNRVRDLAVTHGRPVKRGKTEAGDYTCVECGRKLTSPQGLASHRRLSHHTEQMECPECGKVCQGKGALTLHRKTHRQQKIELAS